MMRYEHPLIIYELDGVLADCAVREAEAADLPYKKGSPAYRKILFEPRRLKQDRSYISALERPYTSNYSH